MSLKLRELAEMFGYTGGYVSEDGSKSWYKDGKRHQLNGPAKIWANGHKEWWLEGKRYSPVNLKDFVVLDHNMGKYGLIWYKLLDKDKVFECPDIPGLFEK
jgi:hypothetical protein